MWVQALVWSTGCSSGAEMRRQEGRGSESVRGEIEQSWKVLITATRASRLCPVDSGIEQYPSYRENIKTISHTQTNMN